MSRIEQMVHYVIKSLYQSDEPPSRNLETYFVSLHLGKPYDDLE